MDERKNARQHDPGSGKLPAAEGNIGRTSLPEVLDFGDRVEAGPAEVTDPVLEKFWATVRRMPKYLKLAGTLATDRRVPKKAKATLAIGGAYTVSPIDLVPGIIPVAGQLDDLVVLLLSLRQTIRSCPPEVAEEHLRRAGLTRTDFDDDLTVTKETVLWLAAKGLRAGRRLVARGGDLAARGGDLAARGGRGARDTFRREVEKRDERRKSKIQEQEREHEHAKQTGQSSSP